MKAGKRGYRPADAEMETGHVSVVAKKERAVARTGAVRKRLAGLFKEGDLFVSPQGSNLWSGRFPEPDEQGTDGPLATVEGARDVIRERKGLSTTDFYHSFIYGDPGFPVTVWIRGGRYELGRPIEFDERDSGPVTFRAYPGETPVFDGGRVLTGWKKTRVNGKTAWVADVPERHGADGCFRRLYVNGESRPRATPVDIGDMNTWYSPEDVPGIDDLKTTNKAFVCREGDIRSWRNLADVEIVFIHAWIEERTPIRSFDPKSRRVELDRRSRRRLSDSSRGATRRFAPYYVENVFEALTEPGQWYLDRPARKVYYIPKKGETPRNTRMVAPAVCRLLTIAGKPERNERVEHLSFEGLVFEHTDWRVPGEHVGDTASESQGGPACPFPRHHRGTEFASAAQAACDVEGVIALKGARYCTFRNCTVRNTGWYGFEIGDGCTGIKIADCELHELGGGGIRVNGARADEDRRMQTGRNRITDNRIHHAGQVFHSAVGILLMHSHSNIVAHNHVHDLLYSGISCGWVWTLGENVSRENIIEKNHIHDIGNGWLDDIGGIYILGVQPGTVVRGNLVHDVRHRNYGARLIYLDACSSHVVVENNICWNSSQEAILLQSGRENIVRNNIFMGGKAYGQVGCLYRKNNPHDIAFTFIRNIVMTDGLPVFHHYLSSSQGLKGIDPLAGIVSDANLFWDVSGSGKITVANDRDIMSFKTWQERFQCDLHSTLADPRFKNPRKQDFSLRKDSPAFALGFKPIDATDAGPRVAGD